MVPDIAVDSVCYNANQFNEQIRIFMIYSMLLSTRVLDRDAFPSEVVQYI